MPSRGRRMAACRQCRARVPQNSVSAGHRRRRGHAPARQIKSSGGNFMSALPLAGHQDSRPDARAGGAAVGADAGRSRRRGDQDRAPRRRRRCARLRPALSERSRGQGEQQQLVLSLRQPQQEIGHRQYRHAGRPGHHPRTGKILRRHDGELQGRRSQALQAGLRIDQGDQPRHHLLLGDRLRPDRALRAARRLRRDPAGDGRLDERHRPYRRRARRRGR